MDNPIPNQTLVNWLMATLGAALGSIVLFYRSKVDGHDKSIAEIREKFVTRDELDKHLAGIAQARRDMHTDNTGRLDKIETSVTDGLRRIHDRIDDIPYRSRNARTRSSDG